MQGWAWIAVGAILLGAELAFIDAQFYLVFVGAAALAVGLVRAAGVELADWLQWLLFAALAVIFMGVFRRRIYERMRRLLPNLRAGPAGETLTVAIELPPGTSCRLEYRGSSWSAVNHDISPIHAGELARIERVDGLTLVLYRAHQKL
jgi:membrane protein implicated in regulation of membrane protease activity